MTREEREKAIDLLDNLRGMVDDNQGNDYDFALKKGIEALEQEPCEDAISRQAVLDILSHYAHNFNADNEIKALPTVEPVSCIATVKISKEDLQEIVNKKVKELTGERKKGFWIMTNDYITAAYGTIDYVKCSCCGEECLEEGNYCPNCGSLMSEEV